MKPLVVVFAKDPIPGHVKTRLAARIGNRLAADLYAAMVSDLLPHLMQLQPDWDIEIHLDRHSSFYERFELPLRLQTGDDLGEKLFFSLFNGLQQKAPLVVVIGSDAPALRANWITKLAESGAQVSLGPTDDGGFWGIQARETREGMFDGVRWSTENALQDTLSAAQRSGLSTALGPRGWDVDALPDLYRLAETAIVGEHTASVLSEIAQLEVWRPLAPPGVRTSASAG